ncbi:ABC transporter ATP-binding protein [Heyndrickxia ginsengihumi]|uniref:Peptide ABC transporter substrate-binding protein n=1 Tax=Heyndrickxia ginsengihumi TaxID=363870 RepID=A0A0A6XYS5_9BACI|nr:ABC transporter ATP-binding protein [Heyndrickxia ginsengihumi]KHD85272.1 peptide ABC transporter substrate-binding protein [Heyndrickxia ginsengihumi]
MLLDIKNLHVDFVGMRGRTEALKNIHLSLQKGEILGIVGESGSGKSITALSILGLLEENAIISSGEIIYNGRDLLQLKPNDRQALRGKEIGMVFQEPMTALHPTMKIGKQLLHVIKQHRNISTKQARELVLQALHDVHIDHPELVAKKYPFELSGGMRQRIVIALAMSSPPNLLIADEPTTALDVTIQYEILNLIKELNQKRGTSVLLITHDLGVVAKVCDRTVVMYAGEVVESGRTKDILEHPFHPYTQSLLNALPDLTEPTQPLKAITGESPSLLHRPSGCAFAARCYKKMEICNSNHPTLSTVNDSAHQAACWLERAVL